MTTDKNIPETIMATRAHAPSHQIDIQKETGTQKFGSPPLAMNKTTCHPPATRIF